MHAFEENISINVSFRAHVNINISSVDENSKKIKMKDKKAYF